MPRFEYSRRQCRLSCAREACAHDPPCHDPYHLYHHYLYHLILGRSCTLHTFLQQQMSRKCYCPSVVLSVVSYCREKPQRFRFAVIELHRKKVGLSGEPVHYRRPEKYTILRRIATFSQVLFFGLTFCRIRYTSWLLETSSPQ